MGGGVFSYTIPFIVITIIEITFFIIYMNLVLGSKKYFEYDFSKPVLIKN